MGGEAVPLNYVPIVIFAVMGAMAGLAPLIIGILFRPDRPYRAKLLPYESGSPLFMDARVQFPMRYYIIAMLFVIFDIEIVFMFPWAVVFKKLADKYERCVLSINWVREYTNDPFYQYMLRQFGMTQ